MLTAGTKTAQLFQSLLIHMFDNRTEVSPSTVCLILVATVALTIGLIQGARAINVQANLSECMAQFSNCEPKASF